MSEFRRPRWIVLSVLIVVFVIGTAALGFWQLRRLDERRMENAIISSRVERAPITVELLDDERNRSGPSGVPISDFEYTVIEATGQFVDEGRVRVRSQVLNSQAGVHGVYPFDLGDGTAVLVNVGWLGVEDDGPITDVWPGELTLTGYVRASQLRPSFGQTEPEGELNLVARIDIDRIQEQVALPLVDYWIQMSAPVANGLPVAAELPDLGEGPHFSYAVQWFSFAAIAAGGYVALARKELKRSRQKTARVAETDSPGP